VTKTLDSQLATCPGLGIHLRTLQSADEQTAESCDIHLGAFPENGFMLGVYIYILLQSIA
jgi:hypothetical protein